NPHAAAAALAAYDSIVWIAGGQLKGVDVTGLVERVAPKLRGAILIGQDRARIADALARHAPGLPVTVLDGGDDAVMTDVAARAAELAEPGDTVLLSPAAASYDMFASYAHRGEAFTAAVRRTLRLDDPGGAPCAPASPRCSEACSTDRSPRTTCCSPPARSCSPSAWSWSSPRPWSSPTPSRARPRPSSS